MMYFIPSDNWWMEMGPKVHLLWPIVTAHHQILCHVKWSLGYRLVIPVVLYTHSSSCTVTISTATVLLSKCSSNIAIIEEMLTPESLVKVHPTFRVEAAKNIQIKVQFELHSLSQLGYRNWYCAPSFQNCNLWKYWKSHQQFGTVGSVENLVM